jgi:RNA polymerase sigma-70 factor (ECF subfamily)
MVRALKTWPYYGIPKNPPRGSRKPAKNLALDLIRREKLFNDKQPAIIATFEQWPTEGRRRRRAIRNRTQGRSPPADVHVLSSADFPGGPDRAGAQNPLRFGTSEIAKAFLTTEPAIAKRLVRARQKVRELRLPFEIPAGEELASRLEGVLRTLYLLFNEGYKASTGENLLKEELCREAIRLGSLIAEHPSGNQPRTHALLALMYLNAARLPARVDTEGNLLRLKEQDRASWSRPMIGRG